MSISIVNPIKITDGMLSSSNVSENDYSDWSSGSNYSTGDRVIVESSHRIYESLQDGNMNKSPPISDLWWIDVGPTNRWKAFDTSNNTQTVTDGGDTPTIRYSLQIDQAVQCIAVLNVTDAIKVQLKLSSSDEDSEEETVYYNHTEYFVPGIIRKTYWNWFFEQRQYKHQYIATDIPSQSNAHIIIVLTGGPNLAVGMIILGQIEDFGLGIEYGAKVGIQDYSRKETNEFGDTVFVTRSFAKRISCSLKINSDEIDSLIAYLSEIRATPCLWVLSDKYESTVVYGFYKNFDILISYPDYADCDLEIEGLT